MRMRSMVVGAVVSLIVPATALAGSGVFRSAFTEINASNANGIASGDFDGDALQDVVTVNAGSANELNVLTGFGDGTLTRAVPIAINRFPSALMLADFTGDQVDDAIVALQNDNTLTFLRGRRDENFFDPPGELIDSGDIGPVGLAAVDFNGDGKRDLVVANEVSDSSPGSVSFLRGEGNGTFTLLLHENPENPEEPLSALPAGLGTSRVVAGELDATPGVEVLALNSRANSISVYTTDGTGFFSPRTPSTIGTGPAPQDLKLVDLDGDSELDLVLAVANADSVTVQRGNGDGSFGPPDTHRVGNTPSRLVVADIDGNDTLDILASNRRSGDVSLLRGDGMGGFGAARTYVVDQEPQELAVGEFNEDEQPDVVAATQGGQSGPSVAILRNRGAGVLHGVEDVAAGNGPSSVAVADIDDDGQPDLVVAGDSGEVLLLRARGESFAPPTALDVGGRALGVVAVDVNGDARPDLAIVDNLNSRVAVTLATGPGQFGPPQFYPVGPDPSAITSGDFNADERADLAVSTIGPPGRVSVLMQLPNGTFDTARNTTVDETPLGIGALDANCDGRDDLVVANSGSDNTVMVLRSLNDGNFELAQTLSEAQVGPGPTAVAVADFNRDGIEDFVVSNATVPQNSQSVRAFRGACDAPFSLLTARQAGNVVTAIVARDFTGDQIVDLALVNQADNVVRLLRNTGNNTFANMVPDGVSRMPVTLAAGDFDADGRYDAATGNSDASSNNVSVLLNCARDEGCNPFCPGAPTCPGPSCPTGCPGSPGANALRGDGNNDAIRSAADLVAVGAEVMDGDGQQVEAITRGTFGALRVSPGIDANGDGIVTAQDRRAVARWIFAGT